jgi:energy-coupling factor transporter transmembrane protein EcfT
MDTTLEVQQARGLNTTGNVAAKLRSYLAVLIPVVVKSLVRAYGMAALLHTRGYASGRRLKAPRLISVAIVTTYVIAAIWVAAAIVVRLVVL